MALCYFRVVVQHLAPHPLVFKLILDLFELFFFLEVILPSNQFGLEVPRGGSLHLLHETWKLVSIGGPRRTSNF